MFNSLRSWLSLSSFLAFCFFFSPLKYLYGFSFISGFTGHAMYCRRSYCKCIVKELFHLTLTPTASSRNQGQGFGRAAFYTEQVFDSFVLEEKGDIADSGIFLLAFYCVLDTASRITFFNSLLSFFYKMCSSILLLGNTSHEVSLLCVQGLSRTLAPLGGQRICQFWHIIYIHQSLNIC